MLACDQWAGTERMVASLIVHSDPDAVRHELSTLAPPGPIAARVKAQGGWVASLGNGGGLVSACWRLGRLLRSRDYDVVTAYGFKASVAARVLVRILRAEAVFVCGVRGFHLTDAERPDSAKARLASAVERALSPLVDVYDANSRAALSRLAALGIEDERLVHIPNGLDLALWKPRNPAREDTAVPLIVCVARFVDCKRHQDLLHALASLRHASYRFRAVLAGDGPTLPAMRELSSRLGMHSMVELPGSIPPAEVRRLLEEAAIACLPSAWEGMPGALMEAMASGVAVVGTDVSGTNELLGNGQSGLLVPSYDPAALAKALARLLDDRALRDRLASGGRRRMEEHFSLPVMLDAKQSLYIEIATVADAAPAPAAHSRGG